MKRNMKDVAISTALFLFALPAFAAPLSAEQLEIKDLIKKVYSFDPDTFEYGEFSISKQPLPIFDERKPSPKKYQPKLHCEFLKNFIVEALIVPSKNHVGCESHIVRYPTAHGQDLSSATRVSDLPKPNIGSPIVQGDKAKISVFTGGDDYFAKGRTLYFLVKTPTGWRISNELVHEKWPEVEEDRCIGTFVVKATPEERMELMPHCR